MSSRKLQTEIDRTLKKVGEGVELFESIYDKMQSSTNQTQKEKLETDLKSQIKKLQRMRDQIKTWAASNDIKDKTQLQDNRKLIETQMEKFKACEKEMKTKAFSKEGLILSTKLDPKAQEKLETTQWLQSQVDELQMQVEQSEAEIETLQGGPKKRGKGNGLSTRIDDLEHLNERRKWHINKLEIVMRLLDNGSLVTDKVLALKEDVSYFVESNREEDFDEYEGIYDELDLDEEEDGHADDSDDESTPASEDIPPRTPGRRTEDDSTTNFHKRDGSPVLRKPPVTLQLRKNTQSQEPAKPPPNPNFAQQPMSSILKAGLPAAPASRSPAQLPPVRYSAVVAPSQPAAANSSTVNGSAAGSSSTANTTSTTTVITSPPPAQTKPAAVSTHEEPSSSPSLTHQSVSVTSPIMSSAASVSAAQQSRSASPALSEAVSGSLPPPAATSSPQRSAPPDTDTAATPAQSPEVTHHPPVTEAAAPTASTSQVNGSSLPPPPGFGQPASQPSPLPQQVQQLPVGSQQSPSQPPSVELPRETRPESTAPRPPSAQARNASSFPGSLQDLVTSFENVKMKAPQRMASLEHVHRYLEGGYSNLPQPQDTEKPKYYVPRHPYSTPTYYPQVPLPVLSQPRIFETLDVETLFYVFYFLSGSYQQYLAAQELKRQSWRFHTKYMTWFQRHSEPQAITDEYEQGVYVYFDWEGSWCQRKKSDFRFEYRYLED